MAPSYADIRAAASRIEGRVQRTPFLRSQTLSQILGCELWLKFENLQFTASFKERGACNKLLQLTPEEARAGVVAMSAGNHAQGVAYHARQLGIPATIVMPVFAPFVKIDNTEKLGAKVVLVGESLDESGAHARSLVDQEGLTFVHPYDDAAIVAGQGTLALEMLEDRPDLDCIVASIGGGGLMSGIAIAAKHLKPEIELVGVQTATYPSMRQAVAGEPIVAGGPTIADGIAVKVPGGITKVVIGALVSRILLVDEASIEAAVLRLLEIEKTVVEGAAAVTLAAIAANASLFAGKRVGVVLSGGNIDSRLLSGVILRGLARTDRLVRLRVAVPDSPGSLAKVTALVADARGNIVDVVHQRAFSRLSVRQTDIDLTIETRNARHAQDVAATLVRGGYPVLRLGDDAP